jgi:serine phosphatase RsbU (regulator of sigma subunit)
LTLSNLIPSQNTYAQADSLLQELKSTESDTVKVRILFELAQYNQRKNDSLYHQYLLNGLEIAKKKDYQKGLVWCYDELGYYHRQHAEYGKALPMHLNALKIAKEINYVKFLPRINNNIGVVYRRLDEYNSAVNYHLQALKYAEKYDDVRSLMYAQNSLGNIFNLMKQYDQAMKYFSLALKNAEKRGNFLSMAINYNNIGEIYENQNNFDLALKHYFKSLEYNQRIESDRGIAICYDCIGSVYARMKQYDKAINYFKQAIDLNTKMNDKLYVAVSLLNTGEALMRIGQPEKSEKYLMEALALSQELGTKSVTRDSYKYLSELYDQKAKTNIAFDYYKKYITFKDSIFNEINSKNVSKLQTLYETEKQRKEIAILEQEKIQREKANEQKTIILLALSLALLILFALAIVLYRSNIIKRNSNQKLESQANLISLKNKELQEQKKVLEVTNNKITDSLVYAQKIQHALLPRENLLKSLFEDYFIIYYPLSVVSGDFYWAGEFDDKLIFTVVDCTGHGVPGAMMSMLGNSYLNETIRKPHIKHASQILNEMRNMIISALHQQGIPGESKDGMEMSLCIYDKKTRKLEFSGAHISIYVLQKESKDKNYALAELKGDRMPVGYYRKMEPFTDQSITVNPDDKVYLFTDGYMDQFGGKKGRRFQSKNLRRLLTENAHKPMNAQKDILEKTLSSWKGSLEQIDDVLIMGIQLPV